MDRPTPAAAVATARVISWNTGSGWTRWHLVGPNGRTPCGLVIPRAEVLPSTDRALTDISLTLACTNCIREVVTQWIRAGLPPQEG